LVIALLVTAACGPSQQEQDRYWENVRLQQAKEKRILDERLLATKTEHVRLTLGEAAAAAYKLCQTYPPATEEHKAKCKQLDDRIAKMQTEEAKNPW